MMVFWIFAAGLVGVALVFVLAPLLRKPKPKVDVDLADLNRALFRQQLDELDADLAAGNLEQARYETARHDLERQLLYNLAEEGSPTPQPIRSGRWAALVLAAAVPAMAIGLYQALGSANIIPKLETAGQPSAVPGDHAQENLPPMEVLVERLAEKLAQDPNNLEGWLMLGRSYAATNQPAKSLAAYKKAYEMAPRTPEVMLAYAEAIAVQNGNSFQGEPARLVQAVLETSPQNPNGLWLAGVVALQRGENTTAVKHWEALSALLPADGEEIATLRRFIAQAKGEPEPAAEPTQPTQVDQSAAPAAATPKGTVSVRVEVAIADTLRAVVKPDDAVFVYAKAFQGPPMPLAVHRAQVKDLPLSVRLDDGMAMTPQLKLSNFPQVIVGARVSPSGSAVARSGDPEGEVKPITPGQTEPVRVTIDGTHP